MPQESQSKIEVKGLHKSFHRTPVLNGVDVTILPNKLTVIIGRSGCGKSTLLRCLNGLERFDEGIISFGQFKLEKNASEANARALRSNFGMVFQSFNLFPHFTVLENLIKAPMIVKNKNFNTAKEKALQLLEKVGLSTHVNHYPAQLSGGQQQMLAIAANQCFYKRTEILSNS